MSKKEKITVQGTEITIIPVENKDYICITDIARHKTDDPAGAIANWSATAIPLNIRGFGKRCTIPILNPSN